METGGQTNGAGDRARRSLRPSAAGGARARNPWAGPKFCRRSWCVDLPWPQRILQVQDLSTDTRWPVFAPVAVALTPVRSLLSFQLLTAQPTMVLNLYADTPNAFTGRCVQLGQVFALDIAVALDAVRRHSEFTHRLALRDLIGQAKGILMQRFGIDNHAALHVLTEMAHHRNQSVAEVARHLIATGGVLPPPGTPSQ